LVEIGSPVSVISNHLLSLPEEILLFPPKLADILYLPEYAFNPLQGLFE